ncbi:MAG: hypothetical protein LBV43_07175 [Prevotella sp.]|nr:hypothetical protein [Prevotella sp.]
MKLKKTQTLKALLLALILPFAILTHAQVTIGIGEEPAAGSLLQMKEIGGITDSSRNAYRGMALPRVTLSKKKELYPMFLADPNNASSGPNADYNTNKPALDKVHTGLTVYNLTEVKSEQLEVGINVWDGEKWVALAKSMGNADFTFNCVTDDVQALGSYIVNKELTISNTLKMKVTVSVPGAYEITATSGNGYFFTASGTFLATGEYTIYAQGQGTPQVAQKDILSFTNNGEAVDCDKIAVLVLSDAGNYLLDCRNTVVNGVYWVGRPLDSNHKVTLQVNVSELGSWNVTSDVVDGISFVGQGTFTTLGLQPIVLYGSGTPSSVVTKTMTFTSNSKGGQSTSCSSKIRMTIPQKRILSLGDSDHSIGATTGIGNMFKNATNFGILEASIFRTETPLFATPGIINGIIAHSSISTYVAPSSEKPVDIIFISYNADLSSNSDLQNLLLTYLRNGGVIIMFNEHLKEQIGNFNFIKSVFNNPAIDATDNYIPAGYAWLQKMPNIDNEIFNGPFGDIRGLYCGNDNGYEDVFTYLPTEDLEWSISSLNYGSNGTVQLGSANNYLMFKHKTYNLIWCGDGGYAAAGNGSATNNNWYPVTTTGVPNYTPSARIYGLSSGTGTKQEYAQNAKLVANILAWAIYQAELNGINSH